MCLDNVDKEVRVTEGKGWKVFDRTEGGYLFQWRFKSRMIDTGRWLHDLNTVRILSTRDGNYPAGYHVFLRRRAARAFKCYGEPIRRVSFKNVVASGTQNGENVIVAREIYIHPEATKEQEAEK